MDGLKRKSVEVFLWHIPGEMRSVYSSCQEKRLSMVFFELLCDVIHGFEVARVFIINCQWAPIEHVVHVLEWRHVGWTYIRKVVVRHWFQNARVIVIPTERINLIIVKDFSSTRCVVSVASEVLSDRLDILQYGDLPPFLIIGVHA